MNQNKKILFYLVLFLFSILDQYAQQEVLIGLDYGYVHNKNRSKFKSLKADIQDTTIISLPLIDDFSNYGPSVDTNYWTSNNVTINNSLGLNNPTLGIATFDAIGENGRMPDNLSFDTTNIGDRLTSRKIKIKGSEKEVYLSFLYQPGGNGDVPEENDSLVLEFYDFLNQKWHPVWKACNIIHDSVVIEVTGIDTVYWKPPLYIDSSKISNNRVFKKLGILANFKTVILPVIPYIETDSLFQFRFTNYYIADKDPYLGKISNCDMWHIDYIKLMANRDINDTVINDIAFVGTIDNILKDYYSIPAHHMKSDLGNNQWTDIPTVMVKNNYDSIINYSRTIILKDVIENITEIKANNNSNINSFEIQTVKDGLSAAQNDMKDEMVNQGVNQAEFEFTYAIKSLSGGYNLDRKENDTIRRIVEFKDYYAYDDGEPELGYGITGNNTLNAKVAVRFEPFIPDTLCGISVYFNDVYLGPYDDSYESFSSPYFYITVWNQRNNQPGDTLYSRFDTSGVLDNGINLRYYQLQKPIYVKGPFYIGWTQVKEQFLNIGFDLSKDNSDKNFFYTSNEWHNSTFAGSIMIRPVFSHCGNGLKSLQNILKIKTYPNPVINTLYVNNENYEDEIVYMITDLQGRIVEKNILENDQIDCSHLHRGIYMVTFIQNNEINHKKIIVAGGN